MKKSFIISSLTALAAFCLCVTAQAQGPLVVSDKDDYSPGETAVFGARGFQAGELLDFSVAVSDENGLWLPDVAWADIPADASGGADVTYVVPETWAGKTLQLTVMGLTSGLIGQTTFTDSVISAVINSPTTANPVHITHGQSIFANISWSTSGDNQTNIHFKVDGTPLNQYNNQANSGANVAYAVAVFGFSVGCHDLTLQVISGGENDVTQTCAIIVDPPPTPTASPTPTPNSTPVITTVNIQDVNLGSIVGCLSSGFATSVNVAYSVELVDANNFNVKATFDGANSVVIATVYDQDGNLPLANITTTPASQTLTFTGPGVHTDAFSTSVTATDTGTPPLSAGPTACGGNATQQITYNFNGFFSPLANAATTKVKQGSTVPVKFKVTDCDGNIISTSNDTISVALQSANVPDGDVTVDDAGASNDNGTSFRWDATGMQDIFNLKTGASLGYVVGNTYIITATLDDGTTHNVSISIK